MKRLLLISVLTAGCASGIDATPLPGQDDAMALILETFGGAVKPNQVPLVVWHYDLDCNPDAKGQMHGFLYKGDCLDGEYWPGSWLRGPAWIEVAAVPGQPFSESALTHEVGHFYSEATTGDRDGNHLTDMFCDTAQVRPCAPDGGRVVQARLALRKARK